MFNGKHNYLLKCGFAINSTFLLTWPILSIMYTLNCDASGADTMGYGCKNPCQDYWITSLIECDHVGSMEAECDPNQCLINSLRYVVCVPEDEAEPCAGECEVHFDIEDWNRWIVVREMPCDSNTPYTLDLGECARDPHRYEPTPCVINECWGELVEDKAEEYLRLLCGAS